MLLMKASTVLASIGLTASLAAGGLAAAAIAASSAPPPTKTVTVNVGQGATGPQGPPGPAGPQGPKGDSGGFECLQGYNPGILVLNAPGGQTKAYVCLEGP
jgi:hypothetical protein